MPRPRRLLSAVLLSAVRLAALGCSSLLAACGGSAGDRPVLEAPGEAEADEPGADEPAPDEPGARRILELACDPRMLRSRIRSELHLLVRALAARDFEEAAESLRQWMPAETRPKV